MITAFEPSTCMPLALFFVPLVTPGAPRSNLGMGWMFFFVFVTLAGFAVEILPLSVKLKVLTRFRRSSSWESRSLDWLSSSLAWLFSSSAALYKKFLEVWSIKNLFSKKVFGRRRQQAAAPYSRSWSFPIFKYHLKPNIVHTPHGSGGRQSDKLFREYEWAIPKVLQRSFDNCPFAISPAFIVVSL